MEKEYEFAREGRQRRNRQGAFGLGWTGGWCVAGLAMNQPSAAGPSPNGAKSDSTVGRRCAVWSPSLGEIKWSTAAGTYARRRPCGAPDVCPKQGFPNNGAGTFRLAGNESIVSGFPFPNRSDKRGGVSRKERINRSQRGAAKAARLFRTDRSGKRFNRRQEVRRVVSVTGRNQMVNGGGKICPASTMRRAGRMSEAGVSEQRSRARSAWTGTNQPSAVFPSPAGATSEVGFLRKSESTGASGARQKAARLFRTDRSGKRFSRRQEVRRVVSVTGRNQMTIGGRNICQRRPSARRTYVRSGGFRTTEQGTFRLDGNESTVSGFPFPSRSDKRGGVSQEERINRSQRGAAKSRAAFPNGPERKTIQSQAGGAPRGLRYWAKSNDYRRPEHMPAATVRRAGRMSEAGVPE
jgi:hypothetical protein